MQRHLAVHFPHSSLLHDVVVDAVAVVVVAVAVAVAGWIAVVAVVID